MLKKKRVKKGLDRLFEDDRIGLAELYAAACDPAHIYCDSETPQRLMKKGFLDDNLSMSPAVRKKVLQKFIFSEG